MYAPLVTLTHSESDMKELRTGPPRIPDVQDSMYSKFPDRKPRYPARLPILVLLYKERNDAYACSPQGGLQIVPSPPFP